MEAVGATATPETPTGGTPTGVGRPNAVEGSIRVEELARRAEV